MAECIFCKIASGEVPCVKIWEDDSHLAFLDNNPLTEGMTVVIPKHHFESYIFDMPRVEYKDLMLAAKKAGKYLDRGLRADRILIVVEGLEVDHAHVKLYPMVKDSGFNGLGINQGVSKTTQELEEVANKIRSNNK
jgi:diadenosine tetraphosphate (Ap4A) HIT family hydrolase